MINRIKKLLSAGLFLSLLVACQTNEIPPDPTAVVEPLAPDVTAVATTESIEVEDAISVEAEIIVEPTETAVSQDEEAIEVAEQTEIVVLYTNDEHGWLEGLEDGSGAAEMMGLWREQEGYEPNNHVVVLSGGDMWTGPAISTWFAGASTAEVMNEMGYVGAAVGNHEFDFGLESLQERAAESSFPFLSANIRYKVDGQTPEALGIVPYVIHEAAGVKIGIVGLTTVDTPSTTNPVNVAEFDFIDYETALREVVPLAVTDGAELIFVPTHICQNELESLVARVADLNIDLFGGGHCNGVFAKEDSGAILLGAGTGFSHYGRARFVRESPADEFVVADYGTPRNVGGTAVPEIEAIIAEWGALADVELNRVIGYTDGIARRSAEMQQLITESWLWGYPTADVAITNLGGMRAEFPAGEITVADVVTVMPFDNVLVELQLTGAQLTEVLNLGEAAVGGASRSGSLWILSETGEALDIEATYSVLVNDFMYAGGDDYQLLAEFDPDGYDTSINWRQPVIDWIEAQSRSEDASVEEPAMDMSQLVAIVDGDCQGLERPLTYTNIDGTHELLSLITNDRCTFRFAENVTFTFSQFVDAVGVYGAIFANDRARLMRMNFDGSVQDLDIAVGGFFGSHIYLSANSSQIVWSDGDGDPDDEDLFVARLWIADLDGGNKRVVYEHRTDLSTAYLAEIFFPIGILPTQEVLFSIEPSGRGGGWIDVGEFSNLYRASTDVSNGEGVAEMIFSCPEDTPFCIGDFTNDLTLFAATDRTERSLFVKEVETGVDLWRTSVPGDSFVGRPKFNADQDVAFVIVDVLDEGNSFRPENGVIGWVDFPYDGFERATRAEQIADLTAWIGDDTFLYYELSRTGADRAARYPLLERSGDEAGVWPSEGRFPIVIR